MSQKLKVGQRIGQLATMQADLSLVQQERYELRVQPEALLEDVSF